MQIKYRITLADFLEAYCRNVGSYRVMQGFGIIMIAVGTLSLFLAQSFLGVGPLAIGVFFLFGWRSLMKNAYNKDRRLQNEFSVVISEQNVFVEGETSKTEYQWSSFIRFAETKNLFLLYSAPNLFNLFPKRSFAPGDADAFRGLAKQKAIPTSQPHSGVVKTIIFWLVIALAAVLLWEVVKTTR